MSLAGTSPENGNDLLDLATLAASIDAILFELITAFPFSICSVRFKLSRWTLLNLMARRIDTL